MICDSPWLLSIYYTIQIGVLNNKCRSTIRSSLLKNKTRIGPYFVDPCVPLLLVLAGCSNVEVSHPSVSSPHAPHYTSGLNRWMSSHMMYMHAQRRGLSVISRRDVKVCHCAADEQTDAEKRERVRTDSDEEKKCQLNIQLSGLTFSVWGNVPEILSTSHQTVRLVSQLHSMVSQLQCARYTRVAA